MCLYNQDSAYVLSPKCAKIWICLNRTWICLKMSEFTMIDRVLNIYHTIHSTRSFCKLMSTYWEIGVLFEYFGKIIISFNYFCKILHLKSLRQLWMCRVLNTSEFWIFVNFNKCDRVLNIQQDATIEGLWIFQDS